MTLDRRHMRLLTQVPFHLLLCIQDAVPNKANVAHTKSCDVTEAAWEVPGLVGGPDGI